MIVDFIPSLLYVFLIIIILIAIIRTYFRTTGRFKEWIYLDNIMRSRGGTQDWICVLGLSHIIPPPKFMGTTFPDSLTPYTDNGCDYAQIINNECDCSTIPVYDGSRSIHSNDELSPISKNIIEQIRKSGYLCICVSGHITDVLIAIKHDSTIAKCIKIYCSTQNNKEYHNMCLEARRLGCTVIELDETAPDLIKFMGKRGKGWLNDHIKPTKAGKLILKSKWLDENVRQNGAKLGLRSPLYLSGVLTVLRARIPSISYTLDTIYSFIEDGLNTIKR